MSMSRIELQTRRKLMRAYILADSIQVQLRRTLKTRTPAGGWITTEGPLLPPQTVRLIVAKRRYGYERVNTEAGDIVKYPYHMIGFHTMDCEVGDTFKWTGFDGEENNFKVMSIDETSRKERLLAFLDFSGGPEEEPL